MLFEVPLSVERVLDENEKPMIVKSNLDRKTNAVLFTRWEL
jgi:hypothetical protein